MSSLSDAAQNSKAWPFDVARKLLKRVEKRPLEKGYVLFETGYGPSGLPHIGTFGEVARTTMVQHAFEQLSDIPTKLICFSDDLDGMRKIPENVPDYDAMATHLQKPLTSVPGLQGGSLSYGEENNAKLREFLDQFGFSYEFISATEFYGQGRMDATLMLACERYDDIMKVMLPTLGEERRQSYSPFLPISPKTGRVLYVPMQEVNAADGTITFTDEDGAVTTLPVTGGNVKFQWKPDFGARWAALDVDFEMFGKDHSTNAVIYGKICEILGGKRPENFTFELFLDDKGEKISKTKGNGLTIDEWLSYASPQSLSYFMYQKPQTAKRMYFDVIPKAVDEYHQQLQGYGKQSLDQQLANPVYHIHRGDVPASSMVVSFAMLLNLASVSGATEKAKLWGFIQRYAPEASAESHPDLDAAAGYAIRYFQDFVAPTRVFRAPNPQEAAALRDLSERLTEHHGSTDLEELQSLVFAVGRDHGFEPLRDWFKALYETLLGASQGPRFGGFIALYGVEETRELIMAALAGSVGLK